MALEKTDPERALKFFEDKLSFTTGPVELSKAMKGGSVNVVDVRSADDFAKEHIPGSVSLPEADWASMRGVDASKLNVLLCYSEVCHLAARAAVELARRGVSVTEMQGGFAAWKSHNLPIESGEQAQDAVERARKYLETRREAERAAGIPAKEKVEAKDEGEVEEKVEAKVEAKVEGEGEGEVEEKVEEKGEGKVEAKDEAKDEELDAEAAGADGAEEEGGERAPSERGKPRRQPAPAR